MSGIPLITKGMISSGDIIITKRYVLPYNLQIRDTSCLDLQIKEKENIALNLSNILDKQLNLKLTEKQINIKNNLDNQINLEN